MRQLLGVFNAQSLRKLFQQFCYESFIVVPKLLNFLFRPTLHPHHLRLFSGQPLQLGFIVRGILLNELFELDDDLFLPCQFVSGPFMQFLELDIESIDLQRQTAVLVLEIAQLVLVLLQQRLHDKLAHCYNSIHSRNISGMYSPVFLQLLPHIWR